MTLLGYAAIAFVVLILGLKIYSVYRRSKLEPPLSVEARPPDHDVSGVHSVEGSGDDSIRPAPVDSDEILMIVGCLVLCAPLGLFLLWKTDRLDRNTKRAIVLGWVALVVLFLLVQLSSN